MGEARAYTAWRPVRGTDVTTTGRLRLDALARYLQEAAEDVAARLGWLPSAADIEYPRPVLPGQEPRLLVRQTAWPAETPTPIRYKPFVYLATLHP